MWLLLMLACTGADLPWVVMEADRSGHFFDRPSPSDELLDSDGTVNLTDFPDAGTDLGTTFVQGWTRQAGETVLGWSHLAPVGVRFDRPIELPDMTDGTEEDPVMLVSTTSGHQPQLLTRFIDDPGTDPFLAPNLLLVQPVPWDPLRSGETYELVVDPKFAKSDVEPVTSFTVQDSIGQMHALSDAADTALSASDFEMLTATDLRRVMRVTYEAAGTTPSGNDATEFTVEFEDGSTEVSYLASRNGLQTHTIELADDPMEVWQATIQTPAFQDLSGQPYASPGLTFLSDFERSDGWIDFDNNGQLLSSVTPEPMRIVIQVPKGTGPPKGIMTWDHGTGGHAYNAINRIAHDEDFTRYRAALAAAGVTVVSRDQPLYGTRYPLVDEGFGASIGFYNIGNLPAWRDNQRQGGIDHQTLRRFATDKLPDLFPDRINPDHVGAFGHSLGSVTAHIGLSTRPADSALMSGSGGNFTYYATDTGLLGSDNDVVGLLGPLLGVELPDNPTGSQAVGALLGVPESGWDNVDGLHPALGLFQLIMDPSDPMVLAPMQGQPEVIVMGIGDLQVPNFTTEWLAQSTGTAGTEPAAVLIACQPLGDYDPHQCLFREQEGFDAFVDYLDGMNE